MTLDAERVLVTGGAGFLGSHLCERLLARGQEVLCVDNFFSGRRTHVAHLVGHPDFELMRHDIILPLYVEVARIFNTYGPRMHPNDGRVVSNFIVQALRGVPLTIYGDGSQSRSFCYVDDLIEGLLRLMDSPAAVTGPVNLGNPSEFTILELAEKVRELTGSRSEIVFRPLPQDDLLRRRPDIGRARELLGWQPTVSLEEGLKRTIGYFDALLAGREALAS